MRRALEIAVTGPAPLSASSSDEPGSGHPGSGGPGSGEPVGAGRGGGAVEDVPVGAVVFGPDGTELAAAATNGS